jgi:hypothetical protein
MKKAQALAPAFARTFKVTSLAAATALVFSSPASAFTFEKGGWEGAWDTTVSYGLGLRVEERDNAIVGLPNGGTANSVNGDDGNLNFDKGDVFTNAFKLSTELELTRGKYGAFFRVNALYDDVIVNDRVQDRFVRNQDPISSNFDPRDPNLKRKVPFTDDAEDLAGKRVELFDAYIFGEFEAGDRYGSWKLGNQVISWGESTFIQNSINAINPIDVSKIRVPGAELKEALLPVPVVTGSMELTENTSLEAFYQLKWEPFRIDPRGTYFSTNDFAGEGGFGHGVLLRFGAVGDTGEDVYGLGANGLLTADGKADFVVQRGPDKKARDDGQFGLAYRVYAPSLNDTEFGFYFMNYHSRLPIISGHTPNETAVQSAVTAANNYFSATGNSTLATAAFVNQLTSADGAATYNLEYPEDIQLYGVSFNTSLGKTGIALQGELSHRVDVPLQVDDVELLLAALGSSASTLACANAVSASLSNLGGSLICNNFAAKLAQESQLEAFGPDQVIPGFEKKDISQFQTTATKAFGNVAGADRLILIGEAGFNYVHNLEDKSVRRYEVNGTYLSAGDVTNGTPATDTPTIAALQTPAKGFQPNGDFADDFSWGYVFAGRLEYSDVFAGINLKPKFSFRHDVQGNSPGPGGSFLENRRAGTLGLDFDYQQKWSGGVAYTTFFGAKRLNLNHDRDFVALNAKYSF